MRLLLHETSWHTSHIARDVWKMSNAHRMRMQQATKTLVFKGFGVHVRHDYVEAQ